MVAGADLYRSTKLLLDRYGNDGASMKADEMLARGDLDGDRVWRDVLAAIQGLSQTMQAGAHPIVIKRHGARRSRQFVEIPYVSDDILSNLANKLDRIHRRISVRNLDVHRHVLGGRLQQWWTQQGSRSGDP